MSGLCVDHVEICLRTLVVPWSRRRLGRLMALALISGSHGLRGGSNLRLASMIIRALHGAGYMLDLFPVKGWRSCVIAVPSSWLTASASGRGAASHLTIGRIVPGIVENGLEACADAKPGAGLHFGSTAGSQAGLGAMPLTGI
jgi:hypothetical protein